MQEANALKCVSARVVQKESKKRRVVQRKKLRILCTTQKSTAKQAVRKENQKTRTVQGGSAISSPHNSTPPQKAVPEHKVNPKQSERSRSEKKNANAVSKTLSYSFEPRDPVFPPVLYRRKRPDHQHIYARMCMYAIPA